MILWLLVLHLFWSCVRPQEIEGKCGIPVKNFSRFDFIPEWHRLVGGHQTVPHSWPWMAEIVFKGSHHCGGSLLNEEYVITAAHCFARSRRLGSYQVFVGGHEKFTGTMFNVSEIHLHPLNHLIRPSSYDVALIRISPKVDFNSTLKVASICLPTVVPPSNKMCVVTGWGRLSQDGAKADTLREIHVPVFNPVKCNDVHHYNGRLHMPSMMCAGYTDGKVDSCQGDSGGPLACFNEARKVWEIQGLVSWGVGCATPGFPGVYTKLIGLAPWVKSTLYLSQTQKRG